jgi:hypothetical protein
MESVQHVRKIQYIYLLKKYIKWGVLRVTVCPSSIHDVRFLKVNHQPPSGADVSERVELHIYPTPHYNIWVYMVCSKMNFTVTSIYIHIYLVKNNPITGLDRP